ncbi:hypothetical protein NEOLEDRAFT_1176768 [Neolentinus lepideus HHB14362 ss-1]|uniref:Insulin-degrading enzyme n=1 Tax=Neolentinus lepideus HHB14362 ss-1 TaxID=1314782 RepID=A0A165TXY7_9AGAM|nr:hypothetical protein NEOLEDRAFT_1176768 [Neolentinus lepideus HHB14362 ss-1]
MVGRVDWRHVPASGTRPAYWVFTKPIEKSQQDDREYRIIELENGLQATAIHDAKADKAAASLDVAVGHLMDPDDMPGLAHFCEHLLFMGTEQFPRENEYSEFLSKNAGSSNAFTATTNTNYYFNVSTPALSGALTRFAAFFHCPLFAPSCTSRELNAVDSEHKKNHQSDMWRIFQLNKHLSKPGHVWSKFGTGHRESLSQAARELKQKGLLNGANGKQTNGVKVNGDANGSATSSLAPTRNPSPAPSEASHNSELEADGGAIGRETRRRLVEWWSKEYCASRMRLCVIGKESLDELSELVVNLFSPVPNRGRDALPMINDHPFGPEQRGTLVSVQTIMDFHVLEISFPLAWQPPLWRYKPANFLAHFVGHEGPGSLHSYLKNKGWITGLSSGAQNLARGFAMFKVTIHMTKDGFQNYQPIMLATYKYLNLLRFSELPAWHSREISTIASIRFRFAEKRRPDDYAVWVAEQMAWPIPMELVISAPQLTWPWDEHDGLKDEQGRWIGEKQVREILEGLKVDEGRAVLMARQAEHEKVTREGVKVEWKQEPWYGTGYTVKRFDEKFVQEAQSPNDLKELFLPGPNEFIPTNLDVDKREVAEPLENPYLIRETPLSSLWHKKDDRFWVPKARVAIDIRTPLANATPRSVVMTRLFGSLVTDSLTEYSYDADLAGLSYNLMTHGLGVWVVLSGYNDKIPVLTQRVFASVKQLKVMPDRLEVFKEQIKRDWQNFFLGQSYGISDYFGKYLLTEKQWTLQEMLPEIATVTAEEVQAHTKQLLSEVNMRMLVTGNMTKEDAIGIAELAESILGSLPSPASSVIERSLTLPEASNYVWSMPVPNPKEPNSALTYYLHIGDLTDDHLRVTSSLLAQILSEPAFNVLRTQEQLGYVVSCSQWHLTGDSQKGLRIVVQSEKPPQYLESRVNAFLKSMRDMIEQMPDEEFAEQKQGLERKWTEKPKNLSEETNRFWTYIDSGYLDFHRRFRNAELLRCVTKRDVIELFDARVHPSASKRAKLSIHLRSQKPAPKQVSPVAMTAFEDLVRNAGVQVERSTSKEEFGKGNPTATEFVKYWQGELASRVVDQDTIKKLLAEIPHVVEHYPVPATEGGEVDALEGVTFIEDVKKFKSSLTASPDPRPLAEWADAPSAKL